MQFLRYELHISVKPMLLLGMDKEEELQAEACQKQRDAQVDISPPTKLARLTPWQVFLREYGESKGIFL